MSRLFSRIYHSFLDNLFLFNPSKSSLDILTGFSVCIRSKLTFWFTLPARQISILDPRHNSAAEHVLHFVSFHVPRGKERRAWAGRHKIKSFSRSFSFRFVRFAVDPGFTPVEYRSRLKIAAYEPYETGYKRKDNKSWWLIKIRVKRAQ